MRRPALKRSASCCWCCAMHHRNIKCGILDLQHAFMGRLLWHWSHAQQPVLSDTQHSFFVLCHHHANAFNIALHDKSCCTGVMLTSVAGPVYCTSCPVLGTFLDISLQLHCRPAPSSPQPSAAAAPSSSPASVSASQALWSPGTPEYIPQYTCQYSDDEAEQAAAEMQPEAGEAPVAKVLRAADDRQPASLDTSGGAAAQKPTAYGSISFAPFAGHRSGR